MSHTQKLLHDRLKTLTNSLRWREEAVDEALVALKAAEEALNDNLADIAETEKALAAITPTP